MKPSEILQKVYERYDEKYGRCLINALTALRQGVLNSPANVTVNSLYVVYGSVSYCLDIHDACMEDETNVTCRDLKSFIQYLLPSKKHFEDVTVEEMLKVCNDLISVHRMLLPIIDPIGIALLELSDGNNSELCLVSWYIYPDYQSSIQNVINVIHKAIGNVAIKWTNVAPREDEWVQIIGECLKKCNMNRLDRYDTVFFI